MQIQTAIVILIVAAAVAYMGYKMYHNVKSGSCDCGCGCGKKCKSKDS